jgi:hypothetical protein
VTSPFDLARAACSRAFRVSASSLTSSLLRVAWSRVPQSWPPASGIKLDPGGVSSGTLSAGRAPVREGLSSWRRTGAPPYHHGNSLLGIAPHHVGRPHLTASQAIRGSIRSARLRTGSIVWPWRSQNPAARRCPAESTAADSQRTCWLRVWRDPLLSICLFNAALGYSKSRVYVRKQLILHCLRFLVAGATSRIILRQQCVSMHVHLVSSLETG